MSSGQTGAHRSVAEALVALQLPARQSRRLKSSLQSLCGLRMLETTDALPEQIESDGAQADDPTVGREDSESALLHIVQQEADTDVAAEEGGQEAQQ